MAKKRKKASHGAPRPTGKRGRERRGASTDASEASRRALIVRLSETIHEAGAAAYRVEDGAHAAAQALGTAVTVFSAPTVLIVAFAPDDTHTLRVTPREVDLARISAVDDIVDALEAGTLDERSAHAALDALHDARPPYGAVLTVLAHAAVAAAVATGFGANLSASAVAASIGALAGFAERTLSQRPHARRAIFLVLAAVASFTASMLSAYAGTPTDPVIIAGLITLFPGFTLTVAVAELATGNLAAGTSRFTAAVLVLMQLALGAALARVVAAGIWGDLAVVDQTTAVGLSLESVAMAVATVALSILLRVPPRLLATPLVTAAFAFIGVKASSAIIGPEMAALVGAFLATTTSNILGRVQRVPPVVSLVPAIILLVPGAVGYRGAVALVLKQTSIGIETVVSMLIIAVTIVAGMVLANAFVDPRRSF